MSINVKTENAKDATVQVHIAFENANPNWMNNRRRRRRATRIPNDAGLRNGQTLKLSTGRNHADHKTRARARRASRSRQKQLSPAKISPA